MSKIDKDQIKEILERLDSLEEKVDRVAPVQPPTLIPVPVPVPLTPPSPYYKWPYYSPFTTWCSTDSGTGPVRTGPTET